MLLKSLGIRWKEEYILKAIRDEGTKIMGKTTILKLLVILTVEAILSIYISNMLGCILEETSILSIELITFSAFLAGTISVMVFLRRKENTEINSR